MVLSSPHSFNKERAVTDEKLLTPKFLTARIAKSAADHVLWSFFGSIGRSPPTPNTPSFFEKRDGHLVIMVPAIKDERGEGYKSWPNYPLQPHVLWEQSIGEKEKWKYPFDNIAKCKALQLWHDRNDDRTDCMPHLLFAEETPFWGGVKRHGIVVAFSGVQPYFDKMISGMVADMCIGLAYHEWMTSPDKTATDGEVCFLT